MTFAYITQNKQNAPIIFIQLGFPFSFIKTPIKTSTIICIMYLKIFTFFPPNVRTCLHKKCVRIFEHNFVADKAKIRRRAAARQGFLTQYAAKFAEKTCAYAYEDRF